MWRHGLLLRSGFLTINRATQSLIVKCSYTGSSLYVNDTRQQNHCANYTRNYAKVVSVPVCDGEEKLSEALGPDPIIVPDTSLVGDTNTRRVKDLLEVSLNAKVKPTQADKSNNAKVEEVLQHMVIDKGNDDELDEHDYNDSHDLKKKWISEQEQLLSSEIEKGGTKTFAEWDDLRSRVLSAAGDINEHNVDAAVIGVCNSFKNLLTGLSYFEYLSSSGKESNVASISKFFKLCFVCSSNVDKAIQNTILSAYDQLRKKYPTFDAGTAENAIHGLSLTKRWKDGIALLDEIRLTCSPNTHTYSALAKAAFDNDDADLGWELMTKMLEDSRKPMLYVYEAWMRYSHRIAAGNATTEQKLVEKLLYFFADNDVRLSEDTVKLIRLWYEYSAPFEANWNAEYTTVDARGMCKSCHRYLNNNTLKDHEFDALRTAFMDKAVVGSNVFLKSTPEELAAYQEFVKKTSPYDIVIDGLNVSYSAGGAGKGNSRTYAKMLQSVVQHFVQRSQKILVLGRKHMHGWPRQYMDYVYDNAHVFLAQNLSQDDPYLLYAAMYSGLGTCFISRDLMRSHAFLLKEPKVRSYFARWQKQHQYQVLYVGDNGNVRLRTPLKFNTSVQRGRDGAWHVPYDLDSTPPRAMALNPPFQWLCLNHYVDRQTDDRGEESRPAYETMRHEAGNYGRETNRSFRRDAPWRRDGDDVISDGEKSSSFRKRAPARKAFDETYLVDDEKLSSPFRKHAPARKSFDELFSDDDVKSSNSFKKREPVRVGTSFDEMSSDGDYKSLDTGKFKSKRFPQRKRYDDDSDNEELARPRASRAAERRPARKTDDWDY